MSDNNTGHATDPTFNVLNALASDVRRLDDLRAAEARRVDEALAAERMRVNEQMQLRSDYDEKLRIAEAKRIDAIRVNDLNAGTVASDRLAANALILANQVVNAQETQRNLVATTATTIANQFAQSQVQANDRFSALEKAQYEQSGRGTVVPTQLTERIDSLEAARNRGEGKTDSGQHLVALLMSGIMALLGIAGLLYTVFHH